MSPVLPLPFGGFKPRPHFRKRLGESLENDDVRLAGRDVAVQNREQIGPSWKRTHELLRRFGYTVHVSSQP
jgi:hypothetical protein